MSDVLKRISTAVDSADKYRRAVESLPMSGRPLLALLEEHRNEAIKDALLAVEPILKARAEAAAKVKEENEARAKAKAGAA